MLEVFTGEALKWYKNKNTDNKVSKSMEKYAQIERYHHDWQLQVLMFYFMYV